MEGELPRLTQPDTARFASPVRLSIMLDSPGTAGIDRQEGLRTQPKHHEVRDGT